MRSPWPFLHAVVESSKYKHASNWNLDILVTPELRRGIVQWPIAERVSSTYVKRAPKLSSLLFSTITTGSLVGHVEMVEITGGERNESSRMHFWIQRYAVIARWSLLWGENSRQGHTKAASTLYKDRVDHMCPSDKTMTMSQQHASPIEEDFWYKSALYSLHLSILCLPWRHTQDIS